MHVEVRFHAELNDFLPAARRHRVVGVDVGEGTTVKDLVESLGVPHTEVDVVAVAGESVGFARRLRPGDRVSVHPAADPAVAAAARSPILHLRPPPPRPVRFVLDVHLGRLARLLRLLGFDAAWRNDADDAALVDTAVAEGRVLLTRDRGILKRAAVTDGAYVRETRPARQIVEVLRRFDCFGQSAPFGRCLACNGLLVDVTKGEVEASLPPRTRRDHDAFRRCTDCGRVYWKGSHYDRLRAVVDEVLAQSLGG